MELATPNDNSPQTAEAAAPPTGNKPLSDVEVTGVEKDSTVVNSSTCVSSEQLMSRDDDEQQLSKSPAAEKLTEEPPADEVPTKPLEEAVEIPTNLGVAVSPSPVVATAEEETAEVPDKEIVAASHEVISEAPHEEMAEAPQKEMPAAPDGERAAAPDEKMTAAPEEEMAAVPEEEMAAVPEEEIAAAPEVDERAEGAPEERTEAPATEMADAPEKTEKAVASEEVSQDVVEEKEDVNLGEEEGPPPVVTEEVQKTVTEEGESGCWKATEKSVESEKLRLPQGAVTSHEEEETAALQAEEAAENELIGHDQVDEEEEEEEREAEPGVPIFETPEAAVESLPKLEPETVEERMEEPPQPQHQQPEEQPSEQQAEDLSNVDQQSSASSRRPHKRHRRESADSMASMRPRKESRRLSTRDDDTEPEQHTKTKRRKTLPARQLSSSSTLEAESITEMSLDLMPDGWKQPLLYFVRGRPFDYTRNQFIQEGDSQSQSSQKSNDRRNARWLRLGDLLIKTGAIYLSPTDTGAPGTPDHIEGPTAILRDLCALIQAGANDPIPLHLGAYTGLGRANARDHIVLRSHNWDTGIGVTRFLKAGNEKEVIQLLPLDLIAHCLACNLRAMLTHSELFPGHLFANPMHLLQFGPTIAIHLAAANRGRQLAELIRIFINSETEPILNELEESYHRGVGGNRVAGGRRRMAHKTKEHTGLRTFPMSNTDRTQLIQVVDSLESALLKYRKLSLEDNTTYPTEFANKEYEQGTYVFRDLQVPLLSSSSTAMRMKVDVYYGLTPCIIDLWEDALPEKTLTEVLKHIVKEDTTWLMAASRRVFMDFTLSDAQEEWILRRGRRELELDTPMPASAPNARLIRHLLHHPTQDVSESAHNCVLEVSIADPSAKHPDELTALVSLKTVNKVHSNEKLILDAGHPLVSWEELANDEFDSDSTSSQT